MNIIHKFFEEYKGARRLSLFWAQGLITYTVVKVLQPEIFTQISTAHATVLVAVIGILATVIGFYQWHRNQDNVIKDS